MSYILTFSLHRRSSELGTDVAMHTAGVTLMRGDPALVADAISISKQTYRKIQQNLFWAFIYNLIGIPLAALGMLKDRKSTRLNSSHLVISYAVFCLKKK